MIYLIFTAKDAKDAKEKEGLRGHLRPVECRRASEVEINDDSEFLPAKLKVRDNLRLMDCGLESYGFDFNNDEISMSDSTLYPASSLTSL